MTPTLRAARGERGFTMMEVLVSLLITIIGLAGVLMMQARTVKDNRQSQQFTRATVIAEQMMESARGMDIQKLLGGIANQTATYKGVAYLVTLTAAPLSTGSKLVRISVTVTYSEDGDTSTSDDRSARLQLLRPLNEVL